MDETPESKDTTAHTQTIAQHEDTLDDYARGTRLVALAASLMLGMFLVALDNASSYDPRAREQRANDIVVDRRSSVQQSPELPTSSTTSTRYRGMVPPIS